MHDTFCIRKVKGNILIAEPEMPAVCSIIHYSQQWGRIEEAETTTSIMSKYCKRAIKSNQR